MYSDLDKTLEYNTVGKNTILFNHLIVNTNDVVDVIFMAKSLVKMIDSDVSKEEALNMAKSIDFSLGNLLDNKKYSEIMGVENV